MTYTLSTVSICAAPSVEDLRGLVEPVLDQALAPLSADPTIAAESNDPASLTFRAARWVERAASRRGYRAEIVHPGGRRVFECGHPTPKIAVTGLDLAPDPSLVDQLYAIGIWSRFISRRRFWAMTVSPTLPADIVANAACAAPVLTVQVSRWRNARIAVVATDLVAAEVTGRALRTVLQPAGDIGETPWQATVVQAAGDRGIGVRSGSALTLATRWTGPSSHPDWHALRARMVRVAHLIDCSLTSEELSIPQATFPDPPDVVHT